MSAIPPVDRRLRTVPRPSVRVTRGRGTVRETERGATGMIPLHARLSSGGDETMLASCDVSKRCLPSTSR